MAAVQTIPANGGGFQVMIEGFARRLDEASGHRFGDWLKDSTGVTPLPSFLTGASFGVGRALESTRTPPSLGDMLIETVGYAVDEARDRLSLLVNNGFIPDTIQELYEYLREHSFELETRINKFTGELVNFLVDKSSRQAVPAAQVDPSLSHANVLALELRSRLKEQIGQVSPTKAYGSWSGFSFVRDAAGSKFGYTAVRGQGYFGRVVGIVSEDPSVNFALLEECRNRGVDVIIPKGPDGDLAIPGMPILAARKSMKAEQVDPRLDHAKISAAFGKDMVSHFEDMAKKRDAGNLSAQAAPSISDDDFARMFMQQEKDIETFDPSDYDMTGNPADMDIVVKTRADGRLVPWDRDNDEEVPFAVSRLPYGEYEHFDRQGRLSGFVMVNDRGDVSVRGLDRRSPEIDDAPVPHFEAPQPSMGMSFR